MRATIVRRQLLAGTLALLVLRIVLALFRVGPLVVADETGYLTNARVLSGGVPGQLTDAPFYRGGYSLLIAPLLALDASPESVYRLVLVVNAVLAASLVPLLYLLLTRSFRTPPRLAVWPAIAAAAYPSVTVFTQVALSENLLLPLTVVWLLCFGELLDARNTSGQLLWAAALGISATALLAVHGRMIVAVALTAFGLCLLAILRRVPLPPLLVGLGVIAGGLVAVRRLDDFLISRNYGGHAPNEVNERLSTLRSVHGVGAFARNLLGQSWYVLVATLGVIALWVVIGGLRGLRRPDRTTWGTPEFVLGLLATTGLGLLVVSALSFPDVERPDMMVYGRYAEVVVPPLLALGLVRLGGKRHSPRYWIVLAAVAASTAAVAALRAGVHPPGEPNRWNIASLPFLTLSLGPLELLGAGAVAAGVVVGLAILLNRAPTLLAPGVLLLFLPTTAVAVNNPVFGGERSWYPSAWTSPGAAAPDARVVAFDTDHGGGVYVYQWFMPRARFVLFSSAAGKPPARYVISSREWGRLHPGLGARPIWTDPGRDHTLFRLVRLGRGRSVSSASPARSGPAAGSSTLLAG